MGKKSWKMTEELARRVQRAFGSDAMTPVSSFTDDARRDNAREFINCILHADITKAVDRVDCTRLVWLPDRGSSKAWQAVIDPTLSSSFSLVVNGTTIGPFTTSTTTAQFQTALNVITTPSTPQGWVIHGNFLIYPATSVTKSGTSNDLTIHEVSWIPLTGDAWQTKVGARRLTTATLLKRGSTQAAEFIHGIGFTIGSSDSSGSGGSSSTGTCPCTCLENGDETRYSVAVPSRMVVTLQREEVFVKTHGKIKHSPAVVTTILQPGEPCVWLADTGDSLTAVYNDGTDATAATTMDAEVRVEWSGPGTVAKLKLCVTGDVPEPP